MPLSAFVGEEDEALFLRKAAFLDREGRTFLSVGETVFLAIV